jgi:hypothetical protein
MNRDAQRHRQGTGPPGFLVSIDGDSGDVGDPTGSPD